MKCIPVNLAAAFLALGIASTSAPAHADSGGSLGHEGKRIGEELQKLGDALGRVKTSSLIIQPLKNIEYLLGQPSQEGITEKVSNQIKLIQIMLGFKTENQTGQLNAITALKILMEAHKENIPGFFPDETGKSEYPIITGSISSTYPTEWNAVMDARKAQTEPAFKAPTP